MSYDDPGSDDGEFLELRMRGAPRRPDAGSLGPDAGAPDLDAGGPSSSPCGEEAPAPLPAPPPPSPFVPTLGDCGLDRIELVNGGSECAVYRELPVADIPIPDDGFVVFCSEDSTLSSSCDVTHAGTRKLPNGWMQNGPDDGMRFVPTGGEPATTVVYEASPAACFGAAVVNAAAESGETVFDDSAVDDVNVSCPDGFVIVAQPESPLRTEPACPAAPATAATTGDDGGAGSSALWIDAGPDVPTGATPLGSATESVRVDEGPTVLLPMDAGRASVDATSADETMPRVPAGCSVGRPVPGAPQLATVVLLLVGILGRSRRRRYATCVRAPWS